MPSVNTERPMPSRSTAIENGVTPGAAGHESVPMRVNVRVGG